jgi:hypothetical protein
MKKSDLQQIIREEISKVLNEDLERNLVKSITKALSKRPGNRGKNIEYYVKSWLSKDKNLMIAHKASGDDYKKNVLNAIQDTLA